MSPGELPRQSVNFHCGQAETASPYHCAAIYLFALFIDSAQPDFAIETHSLQPVCAPSVRMRNAREPSPNVSHSISRGTSEPAPSTARRSIR
ncbi:hypothetical protein F01_460581 [Burkholderia cenocepacia]|nr:hypothetical protein F01_460581 [Burkholderia cenocepacia]